MSAVPEAPTADEIGKPTGASLIAAERQRQKDVEGYTDEHDAEHGWRHFWNAGRAYEFGQRQWWPFDAGCTFKPKNAIRDFIRAGALYQVSADLGAPQGQAEVARCAQKLDATLTAAYPLLVARIANQAKAEALREAADDVNASGVAPVLAKWLTDRADRIEAGNE